MILFVVSLVLAILAVMWIAWIAFEPRSKAMPTAHGSVQPFIGAPSDDDAEAERIPASDEMPETDYQRHVRNRIEESQLPLGTITGSALPVGPRITPRESDSYGNTVG